MQVLHAVGCHELRRLRVCRGIASHIRHFLLGSRVYHIFQKLVSQIFILASSRDHQVVDPAGRILLRNSLPDRKVDLAQLVRHERPAHSRHDFMVLE